MPPWVAKGLALRHDPVCRTFLRPADCCGAVATIRLHADDAGCGRSPDRATRPDRRSPLTPAVGSGSQETCGRPKWHGRETGHNAVPRPQIVAARVAIIDWRLHFLLLTPFDEPLKRDFYAEMCRIERRLRLPHAAEAHHHRQPRLLIDLLFYHRRLRRLVVIELKLEAFQAAHRGRWNSTWLAGEVRTAPRRGTTARPDPCAGKSADHVELLQLDAEWHSRGRVPDRAAAGAPAGKEAARRHHPAARRLVSQPPEQAPAARPRARRGNR